MKSTSKGAHIIIERKIESKNKKIDLLNLILNIINEFSAQIDSFEDFVTIAEIETSIIITEKDIMRLMNKGKLNEHTIRNRISDQDKSVSDFICAIFDTKEWVGR